MRFEDYMHNALAGMLRGPRPLAAAVGFYAQQEDAGTTVDVEAELLRRLPNDPNDDARKILHRRLAEWDHEPDAPWTGVSRPNTLDRRRRIYELLQIDPKLSDLFDKYIPAYTDPGEILVDNPEVKKDWYTFDFRREHDFYWKRVSDFLATVRRIPSESIASIDASTTKIMQRLGDPAAVTSRKGRGLVVGYVQSGKTTNFTGVIAKAVDAGYRLVIVLSGTTNLLRNQTQRRLDMDLIGRENILHGTGEDEFDHHYKGDPDWPARFISYGKQPALLGHVNITRLTGPEDFKGYTAGINPLDFNFEKKDRLLPLYHRQNLAHAGARLIVVKKNNDRLRQLLRDLKAIGQSRCDEIPALVIDDESDQASVNTVNPEKETDKTRSSINKAIVQILERLPRAQYLGYTATPFANVLVNADDPADIYPRDFILSLDRPMNYMGVREFHDFAITPEGQMANERAYVRSIPEKEVSTNDRLLEALDAFVLAGAIKKFREKTSELRFKHHTMLFHQSSFNKDQEISVDTIRRLWKRAAYDSPGPTTQRLSALLEDFRDVWADRGKERGLAFPRTFDDLKPALGSALADIRKGDPVLMVNSAEGADVPDFDAKDGVWKIIVGGAKLSRGYTIEGLTISYFRRSAKVQDTLMQMGRWFGYREGYQDLVRLYIGRNEPAGKTKTLDLYKAFEAMCRDEEDFREQLAMYSEETGFTPVDVRALVFNSHPQLRPAARNKMYYAELAWAAFSYREPTSQAADSKGRKKNAELFSQLLGENTVREGSARLSPDGALLKFKWSAASQDAVVGVLKKILWDKAGSGIGAEIEYLTRDPRPVESWAIVAPQVGERGEAGTWRVGDREFNCISRRRYESRFNVFSTPRDVQFAKWLVGDKEVSFNCRELQPNRRRGILLFYPTFEKDDESELGKALPVMGFSLVLPSTDNNERLGFRSRMKQARI